MGVDYNGEFLDTIFDVISLGMSVAEVVANPADPWAWAGLVGDIVDLVPGVTGVGEITKGLGATRKAAKAARKASKATGNATDAAKVVKQTSKSLGGACFIAGTEVLSESGPVPIETIQVGDMVWATDPETGETALKPVVQTFVNEAIELVHVGVSGEEIICTNEHPFYSPVKGWTAACKLRAGDILQTVNDEYVVVEWVQHELLDSPIKVYNFEVADLHTYFVGECCLLVHNSCAYTPDQSALIELAKEKRHGVSGEEAEILVGWAKEYGVNYHAPAVHKNRSGIWSRVIHIKIANIHIPVKPMKGR